MKLHDNTKLAVPTHEQIELRAYQMFVERGYGHGHDLADWFAAEQELVAAAKRAPAPSAARSAVAPEVRPIASREGRPGIPNPAELRGTPADSRKSHRMN
jgi:hypothetical protein